jgi:hypothetical protein
MRNPPSSTAPALKAAAILAFSSALTASVNMNSCKGQLTSAKKRNRAGSG